MGANRKLQQDIDRTLKKVTEGIEIFDQIWDKVYDADTALPLKEKFEGDLKKEIKKLQRYRDQIKTWISSSDIKDKTNLTNARKAVERQMERFKVCEKETKTKAFSKEGLGQAAKLDPREKKRSDTREWLSAAVGKLNEDLESFDAELEGLQTGGGKKRGKPPPRLTHLEESISRHKTHVARLEAIMRLLDNEAMEADETDSVKELIEDYLERNQDAFEEFENPEDVYESIEHHMDNVENIAHIKGTDPKEKEKEKEKERERERERDRERAVAAAAKLQLQQAGINLKLEDELEKPPASSRKEGKAKDRAAAAANGPAAEAAAGKDAPAATTAAAAAAAPQSPKAQAHPSSPAHATASQPSTASSGPATQPAPAKAKPAAAAAAPAAATPAAATPPASHMQPHAATAPVPAGSWAQPHAVGKQEAAGKEPAAAPAPAPPSAAPVQPKAVQAPQPSAIAPSPFASPSARAPDSIAHQSQGASSSGRASTHGSMLGEEESRPAMSFKEESRGFEQLQEPEPPLSELDSLLHTQRHSALLSAALERSMPVPALDSQWPVHPPRLRGVPPGSLPDSYPHQRLPVLEDPRLYEKLDTEALFWAFYYQPDTFQQHLAARELKRQFWRYHKHHGAWFQRHEEPRKSTDEYEQGTYVYFDHHIQNDEKQSGWCYRLKQDFVFKYDALEGDLES